MLHIIGDIDLTEGYFDKGLGIGNSLVDKKEDPFEYLSRRDDDLWIGNFECVCSDVQATGSPFIINPCHLEHIRHFDCYGIANNHVMQFGDEAYREMEAYFCRKGIKYAGSLKHRSVVFEHQGKRVGFMAFSQRPDNFSESPLYWHLPEYIELEEELNRLHDCDYRIVFVHWGYEFINYPNIDQKNLGRWLVDVGYAVASDKIRADGNRGFNGRAGCKEFISAYWREFLSSCRRHGTAGISHRVS